MKILNRFTGMLIMTVDTLSGADLSGADLRRADLSGADLSGADLSGAYLSGADLRHADLSGVNLRHAYLRHADLRHADLSGADLRWTTGNNREILTIQSGTYLIVICGDEMFIGCESHTIGEWMSFSDSNIHRMDDGALTWWKTWKPIIKSIIDTRGEVKS